MSSFKIKQNINKTCVHCSRNYSITKLKCPHCNLWGFETNPTFIPIKEINFNIKNIYIINLQRDIYRLNSFFINLKKSKISIKNRNWNKFNAVDGSNINTIISEIDLLTSDVKLKEKIISIWKKYNGSIGCYLSHIKLWKNILDDENTGEYSLIMEDDSTFTPNGLINIEISLQTAKNMEWDILYAGHSKLKGKQISSLFLRPYTFDSIKTNTGRNYGFFGYIVRKSSLPKIIENAKNFGSHNIDVQIRNSCAEISCLFCISNLIRHTDTGGSTRKNTDDHKIRY